MLVLGCVVLSWGLQCGKALNIERRGEEEALLVVSRQFFLPSQKPF
jgi:hypothetical protein